MAELLLKSRRPVLHTGQGVLYADATQELARLAELLQAPVMTTNTGKSAFPEHHPLSIGASVISAPKAVVHFLKKADLIVGIGASFEPHIDQGYIPRFQRLPKQACPATKGVLGW